MLRKLSFTIVALMTLSFPQLAQAQSLGKYQAVRGSQPLYIALRHAKQTYCNARQKGVSRDQAIALSSDRMFNEIARRSRLTKEEATQYYHNNPQLKSLIASQKDCSSDSRARQESVETLPALELRNIDH